MSGVLICLLFAVTLCGQSTRELNDLNWMEFQELVPAKIETVLLPVGTLEAHGVANNGADNTAPEALARRIAPDLNALVAPALPYGITGRLDAYAGSMTIGPAAYKAFVGEVLRGLARNRFKNIIIVNGHGGNTDALNELSEEVGRAERVRVMVINWWGFGDVTQSIFGEDGGHAGWNETAMIQAINPKLVHPDRYNDALASPRAPAGLWWAYPTPSSIILYQPEQGYVKFDQAKADEYYAAISARLTSVVKDTIARWDNGKLFR